MSCGVAGSALAEGGLGDFRGLPGLLASSGRDQKVSLGAGLCGAESQGPAAARLQSHGPPTPSRAHTDTGAVRSGTPAGAVPDITARVKWLRPRIVTGKLLSRHSLYMHIYVYMYACAYVHVCMNVCVCRCVYIYIYLCIYIHILDLDTHTKCI